MCIRDSSELARFRDGAVFAGRALEGAHHLVVDLGGAPGVPLGPVGRTLAVVSVRDVDEARARLASPELACVGTDRPDAFADARVRVAELGAMQRPPLDGPVDLRV